MPRPSKIADVLKKAVRVTTYVMYAAVHWTSWCVFKCMGLLLLGFVLSSIFVFAVMATPFWAAFALMAHNIPSEFVEEMHDYFCIIRDIFKWVCSPDKWE